MRMRRQMSEGRPGGNVRKKKKDNLNNRMALVGVTMVVLSLAVAVHIKGIDLKEFVRKIWRHRLRKKKNVPNSLRNTAYTCRPSSISRR